MQLVDFFSGIGGFSLAAEWVGWKVISHCEIDPYCQKVLNKHWPDVYLHDDIKTFTYETLKMAGWNESETTIFAGGFPCQPFSQAGKRRGTSDSRNLWPEYFRVIKEIQPDIVVGENVAGLLTMENGKVFDWILSDLESEGYQVESFLIPACGVEAWHRRERVWILAHSIDNSNRAYGGKKGEENSIPEEHRKARSAGMFSGASKDASDTDHSGNRTSGRRINRDRSEENERQEGQSQLEPSRHSQNVANSKRKGLQESEKGELRIPVQNAERGSTQEPGNYPQRTDSNTSRSDTDSIGSQGTEEYQHGGTEQRGTEFRDEQKRYAESLGKDVPNTTDVRSQRSRTTGKQKPEASGEPRLSSRHSSYHYLRKVKSGLGGMANGISDWMDRHWDREPEGVPRVTLEIENRTNRLKILGNAIVPQVAFELFKVIDHENFNYS